MSTKTTLKRIALVAVSALGFGLLSVAPSNAIVNADAVALSATTSTVTVGSATTITVTPSFIAGVATDAVNVTATLSSAPTGNTAVPTFVAKAATLSGVASSTGSAATWSATVTTSAAHSLSVGDRVTIAAAVDTDCRVTAVAITAVTSTTFTYPTTAECSDATSGTVAYVGGTNSTNALSLGDQVLTTTSVATGGAAASFRLTITPNKVGTYVVNVAQAIGTTVRNTATWTITVADFAAVSAVYSKSLMDADATNGKVYADTDDVVSVALASATAGTKIGVIRAFAYTGLATDRLAANTIYSGRIVSGPATITTSSANTGGAATGGATSATSTTNGNEYFAVYATGVAGTIKVEISAAGVVIGTETLVVYGAASKYTVTNLINTVGSTGVATAEVVEVAVTDANGNPVSGHTVLATRSPTTLASVTASAVTDADGLALFAVTGTPLEFGTLTVSFANAATSATITGSTTVTVSSVRAATLTVATNKSSYEPGEKITFTLTAKDANGLGLPTGTYAVDSIINNGTATNPSVSANLVNAIFPSTSALELEDGVATAVGYAPLTSGPVTLVWTLNGTAGGLATTNLAAALVGTTVTSSFTVTGGAAQAAAEAASDAAAEAIDAANAATDAANLAAEAADAATVAAEEARDAADAATAAVEELATQVATLMAALKAQITTLANTVAKIAKKVKA